MTTLAPARSSSLTVSTSACHAPTPPLRTVRPSASFVPLIMLCAPFCSKLPYPLTSGLKHFRQLPTSLTSYPPKCSRLARRMPPSLALRLPMTISAFSGVSVILTCLLLLPTSCPPGRPSASSWVTLLIIKDTAVLTFPPTESSSPDTSFSMSPRSLMPSRAPLPHRLTLIFWILLTVCQHLSVLCIRFSLQVLVFLTPHSHVQLRPALLWLVQQR